MRSLLSSFLIVLILMNLGGYYAIFWGIEYKAAEKIAKKLDADFFSHDETQLIKIPVSIPYATDSRDFERVDGKIEHEGQVYRLVKQKLAKDTLHVVIIKDKFSTKINKAKTDLAKTITEKPLEKKQGNGIKIFKNLLKDYISHLFYLETINGWFHNLSKAGFYNFYTFLFSELPVIPPEI